MLRGRPALASVFLGLVLLPVFALQLLSKPKSILCSSDILHQVRILLNAVQDMKWLDSRLYTPTMDDYTNCPRSTLSCFAEETDVVLNEWELLTSFRARHLRKSLVRGLRMLSSRVNQTVESKCHTCEGHDKEEAKAFLERLSSILHLINSVHCQPIS